MSITWHPLTGREEDRWPVVLDAEAAYEAIRSINLQTNERWLDSSARP